MTNISLVHSHTPPELQENSLALEKLINSEDIDEEKLLELIDKRDQIINECIENVRPEDKKLFLEYEVKNNELLSQKSTHLLKSVEEKLTKFVRSRNAIKNYE